MSESSNLARERRIRAGAWKENGELHNERRQFLRRRVRTSKDSLPGGNKRKHKRVIGRKSSPGASA